MRKQSIAHFPLFLWVSVSAFMAREFNFVYLFFVRRAAPQQNNMIMNVFLSRTLTNGCHRSLGTLRNQFGCHGQICLDMKIISCALGEPQAEAHAQTNGRLSVSPPLHLLQKYTFRGVQSDMQGQISLSHIRQAHSESTVPFSADCFEQFNKVWESREVLFRV